LDPTDAREENGGAGLNIPVLNSMESVCPKEICSFMILSHKRIEKRVDLETYIQLMDVELTKREFQSYQWRPEPSLGHETVLPTV
jgi:hypothetical protein